MCHATDVHPLLVQLLYNRGITDPGEFGHFLSIDRSLANDPLSLPDMPQAISRIFHALLRGEKIAVFGDFDADGVTATVILVECLENLGADVIPYLPHRSEEGHGLSFIALEEFRQGGVSLIITVDCGITSVAEVARARELGIDVIVTDHHTVSSDIPLACAIVDPKRPDSSYAFPHLAGVGVAFKLVEALTAASGKPNIINEALCLVALGTIADMSPLVGENRYLVKCGLDALAATERPGIRALLKNAGVIQERVSSNSVAWDLAPRLNAAGRIEHAQISYRLLHTRSNDEAEQLAGFLEEINRERQALVEVHWGRARSQVLESQVGRNVLLVCDPEFPAGVCGLVASRLVDEFRRPAIVLQTGENVARGSCRSIPEYDIISALGRCSDLFTQFGGHPAAAGFSIAAGSLERLKERLMADADERLAGVDSSPVLVIDAVADPSLLTGDALKMLQRLAPHGQGNRSPLFMVRGIEVVEARQVGNAGQHLKMRLRCAGKTWPAIGFGLGSRYSGMAAHVDVAYTSQVNRWNGNESLELNVTDFRLAS